MKAYLHSARIAPKKANLIARMVRGMKVPAAVTALERTNKKAARLIEKLLKSAMANASHNEKQDPAQMIISAIIVNQGQAYRRGMPKARGQTRPYRKFLSHIELELGYPSDGKNPKSSEELKQPRKPKKPERGEKEAQGKEKASQKRQNPVQKHRSKKDAETTSSVSSPHQSLRSDAGQAVSTH